MSIYTYRIKQDKHKTWKTLSVATKHPMDEWEMHSYVVQYAVDNQVSQDTVAIQCLNLDGTVVAERLSSATINRA